MSTGAAGFTLLVAGDLTVTGAAAANGISITTSGTLAIRNTVNAGTNTVSLSTAGKVTQTSPAVITARNPPLAMRPEHKING